MVKENKHLLDYVISDDKTFRAFILGMLLAVLTLAPFVFLFISHLVHTHNVWLEDLFKALHLPL